MVSGWYTIGSVCLMRPCSCEHMLLLWVSSIMSTLPARYGWLWLAKRAPAVCLGAAATAASPGGHAILQWSQELHITQCGLCGPMYQPTRPCVIGLTWVLALRQACQMGTRRLLS